MVGIINFIKLRGNAMKKWIGKLTAIFASAVLMMGAAMPVCATESKSAGNWSVDTGKTDCSISLTLTYKDTATKAEKNMSGGELALYKVATVKEENGYSFDISGGQFAGYEEVEGIPGIKTSTELDQKNPDITKKLEAIILSNEIRYDKIADVADGSCKFENLTPGLYLVRQDKNSDGGIKINPFLVSIPDEHGEYYIVADPKTEVEVPTKPDNPPKPENPPKPGTPPSSSKKVLPQTGQLWWPVPVLCAAGLALVIGGYMLKRRKTA